MFELIKKEYIEGKLKDAVLLPNRQALIINSKNECLSYKITDDKQIKELMNMFGQ